MQQLTPTEVFILISSAFYIVVIGVVLFFGRRRIRYLKKQLSAKFPENAIEQIRVLLERLQHELPPGDFRLVMLHANRLPAITNKGEFSYLEPLHRVLFTDFKISAQ